jgi:hypothetical protein
MSLAAVFSGLEIEYIDGVTSVEDQTLPPGGVERGLNKGSIYGWRAHECYETVSLDLILERF